MGPLARDLMQRNVGIIDASATLAELERAFADANVSGFPVVDVGGVVGVVSRTDVVRRLAASEEDAPPSSFYGEIDGVTYEAKSFGDLAARHGRDIDSVRVCDVMSTHVVSVAPDAPLTEVARALVEHHVHRVLVVDGTNLVGIVSSLDLARLVADGSVGPR
jgi:CBS domain-containing protein